MGARREAFGNRLIIGAMRRSFARHRPGLRNPVFLTPARGRIMLYLWREGLIVSAMPARSMPSEKGPFLSVGRLSTREAIRKELAIWDGACRMKDGARL